MTIETLTLYYHPKTRSTRPRWMLEELPKRPFQGITTAVSNPWLVGANRQGEHSGTRLARLKRFVLPRRPVELERAAFWVAIDDRVGPASDALR